MRKGKVVNLSNMNKQKTLAEGEFIGRKAQAEILVDRAFLLSAVRRMKKDNKVLIKIYGYGLPLEIIGSYKSVVLAPIIPTDLIDLDVWDLDTRRFDIIPKKLNVFDFKGWIKKRGV